MKRTFAAVALALALLLTGCGSGDQPDTTGDSVSENTQTDSPASPAPTQ